MLYIMKRPSGGRGEYEMAGGDSHHAAGDLADHRIRVQVDDGHVLDTGVELRVHGGKLRLRIVEEGAMHIHRQLVASLLLPRPIREEARLSEATSPVEDRNYLVRRVGIRSAAVGGSTATLNLSAVELESKAFAGSLSWDERWARVMAVHDRRNELPWGVSVPLAQLVGLVLDGRPLATEAERLVRAVMQAGLNLKPSYDGRSDVLGVLEGALGISEAVEVPEVEEVVQRTAVAAGRRRSGQGFSVSVEHRKAVELHAMDRATAHFEGEWENVVDVSAAESYDLLCTSAQSQLRVEVKGTASSGETVLLTPNEVTHARANHPNTALFVLSGVVLNRDDHGAITASGGTATVIRPWHPEPEDLKPTGFQYEVPAT